MRRGATPSGPGSQPLLNEVTKALLFLLFLVTTHQITDVLTDVDLVACGNPVVDVLPH